MTNSMGRRKLCRNGIGYWDCPHRSYAPLRLARR